ncbi:MAG TPA: DUF4394 domain-containing protein [Saprospiraceae bacterium]|nr:DUF4394 domain-containing protein [Saprospiraceae bacterium]
MRRANQLFSLGFSFLLMILLTVGCSKDDGLVPDGQLDDRGFTTAGAGKTVNFFAISDRNELLRYKAGPPAQLVSVTPFIGLGPTEHMLAIDIRPSNGVLYGISDSSTIYLIATDGGQAKPVGKFLDSLRWGSAVGFDFDPFTDQIRLITDQGQNLRIDPDFGTVVGVDLDINPVGAVINSVAYARVATGATRTFSLYDIDASRGVLMRQDPPNDGLVTIIGPLGLIISGEGGFDIGSSANSHFISPNQTAVGYAVLYGHAVSGGLNTGDNLAADAYRLWEINLETGRATYKGLFDRNVIGIAVP